MARHLTSGRRRAAYLLLALAVAATHLLLTERIAAIVADWGRAAALPERLRVAFVREIKPAPPPAAPPAPPPAPKPPKRRAAAPKPPAPAASQPDAPLADARQQAADTAAREAAPVVPDLPIGEVEPAAQADAAPAVSPASAAAAAPTVAQGSAAAASQPEWPSQWPASTRLSYTITGWYRGEVHGEAMVEWLREGTRYQVHLDVSIGPSLAPLMSRRMTSDGELTAAGLRPRRYDEETRVAFSQPRRVTLLFEPDAVVMPDGRRRERLPDVQDAASQFVHLVWLFTMQPQLLTPGNTIQVPLALPRSIDLWIYDVLAADELQLPFGALPVVHLKPRRVTRPRTDLVVETWFAPTLLYLPVRMRIHQDAETYLDLLIDRPPLQAAR